jgi:putative sterol carrier protein
VSTPLPIASPVLADPARLLEEWIFPRLTAELAARRDLHDISAELELVLGTYGTFTLEVERGGLALKKRTAKKPSIILELDASDLAEFVLGALSPSAALLDGRLELAGDVGLAMRLAPLFSAAIIS